MWQNLLLMPVALRTLLTAHALLSTLSWQSSKSPCGLVPEPFKSYFLKTWCQIIGRRSRIIIKLFKRHHGAHILIVLDRIASLDIWTVLTTSFCMIRKILSYTLRSSVVFNIVTSIAIASWTRKVYLDAWIPKGNALIFSLLRILWSLVGFFI